MQDSKLVVFCDWSALMFPLLWLRSQEPIRWAPALTITLKQFIPDYKRRNCNRKKKHSLWLDTIAILTTLLMTVITITIFDSHSVLTLLTIRIAITKHVWTRLYSTGILIKTFKQWVWFVEVLVDKEKPEAGPPIIGIWRPTFVNSSM